MRELVLLLLTAAVLMPQTNRAAPDPKPAWKAPVCGPPPFGLRVVRGSHMQVVVPGDVWVRSGYDTDYGTNVFCIGNECMRHGFGGTWSSGDKSDPAYFATAAEITRRDVYDRYDAEMILGSDVYGNEYRGTRKNGTRFRFVGVLNETIEYDGVSGKTAATFDRIIDSMCWVMH